jgi:hypothetical protein
MRARTSASHACGSMSFNFAVTIRLYMAAARRPPRSEPGFSSKSDTPQPALGCVVRQADAAVVEEACEGGPSLQHVIHGFGKIAAAGELRPLGTHASFQLVDERPAKVIADCTALVCALGRNAALDLEQPIHALHDLQRQRRDRCWRFAFGSAPRTGLDIGKREERPARMCPAGGFQDQAR